jgi:hypothetical protein
MQRNEACVPCMTNGLAFRMFVTMVAPLGTPGYTYVL